MNKLHFLNFNGFLVLDSRNIAEVLGESHQDLVREICSYTKEIDEDSAMEVSTYFFIPSAYISTNDQIMPSYLISKMGCDYIAEKRSNKQCVNQKEGEKMENITLLNFEGQDVLDSRDVAQMIGKRHDHLVRDIDKYIDDIDQNPNLGNGSTTAIASNNFFIPSTYTLKNGRQYRNYLLTKQGCEFVANKMTGKKGNQFTAAYVGLFNSMQKNLQDRKPDSYMIDDPVKRAERWIEERKAYEKVLPKAEYYDSQMRNPGLMTVTEIAKDYGWSGSHMNQMLKELKVIYRQGSHWVLYQKYANKGYGQYEPYPFKDSDGKQNAKNNLKWTQKGRKFIYDLLAGHGIKPVLERHDFLEMDGE